MAWGDQVMPLYTGLSTVNCLANFDDFVYWFFSRILASIDLNIGPYVFSIIFSVGLFMCTKRQVCSVELVLFTKF